MRLSQGLKHWERCHMLCVCKWTHNAFNKLIQCIEVFLINLCGWVRSHKRSKSHKDRKRVRANVHKQTWSYCWMSNTTSNWNQINIIYNAQNHLYSQWATSNRGGISRDRRTCNICLIQQNKTGATTAFQPTVQRHLTNDTTTQIIE